MAFSLSGKALYASASFAKSAWAELMGMPSSREPCCDRIAQEEYRSA